MSEQHDPYECLRLQNQLCFPLYAVSKEIIRRFKPYLERLDLTYTQYITMMVLWEEEQISSRKLGSKLYLDSGTLTPVLRKLENKGYLTRTRSQDDERNLIITITPEGRALKKKAANIHAQMGECICLAPEEAEQLYQLLYKLLEGMPEG